MTDEQIRRVKELRDAASELASTTEKLLRYKVYLTDESYAADLARIERATEAIKKVEGLIV